MQAMSLKFYILDCERVDVLIACGEELLKEDGLLQVDERK
jgi:hypothetical protein